MTTAGVGSRSTTRRTDLIVLAVLVVLGTIYSLIRVPFAHLDTVWAEDANIFLVEAIEQGSLAVLFESYAGYQHLIPRLGAALVLALFPLAWYGAAIFVLCALLTSLSAWAVYYLSRQLVPWLPARLSLAAITLTLPLASSEVLGNLADIHSYCMWLVPWLVLYRPPTRRSGWLWGVVTFLCVMTEVQAVIFLLLLPLRLRRREPNAWPVLGALVLGSIGQLGTTLLWPRDNDGRWLGVWAIVKGWLVNTVLPLVSTDAATQVGWLTTTDVLVPGILAIFFGGLSVYVLVRGNRDQRVLLVTLLVSSAAIYAGGAIAVGSEIFAYGGPSKEWNWLINVRYGVSSGMLLAAVLPLWTAVVVERARSGTAFRGATLIAPALLVVLIGWFAFASTQTYSWRTLGPWSVAVQEANLECEGAHPQRKIELPVGPDREVFLTCEQLRRVG